MADGILYTPAASHSGSDTFSVTVTDARGATVSGTVTVTVGPPPDDGGVGTNPPSLTMGDGEVQLSFHGVAGASYQIQRSSGDLVEWDTLETVTTGATGIILWTDDDPPFPRAFYRLRRP